MSKSNAPRPSRKAPDRPKKPYPEFPLTPHASGAWQKKILGKTHYFGKWARRVDGKLQRVEGDGWKEALEQYKVQADDLHAGRTPRVNADGLTLASLCNQFLTAKLRKKEAGELGERSFAEYKATTDLLIATFGVNRLVDDLAADDFAQLRSKMTAKWGPTRMVNEIVRVKGVFKYGTDNGLIEKAVRYGSEFKPPSRSVLRRHRAKSPAKMLEAAEVRAIIDVAGVQMKAMILLGVNCGLGNTDIAEFLYHHVNLNAGTLDYPRPKTGIARRCPLWPETVEALKAVEGNRPKPRNHEDVGHVFRTRFGRRWGKGGQTYAINLEFGKLLKKLGLKQPGLGFYTLRYVFRTVADEMPDAAAINLIMGHGDASIAGHYRERIDDSRLKVVADHVRKWLWPAEPPKPAGRGDGGGHLAALQRLGGEAGAGPAGGGAGVRGAVGSQERSQLRGDMMDLPSDRESGSESASTGQCGIGDCRAQKNDGIPEMFLATWSCKNAAARVSHSTRVRAFTPCPDGPVGENAVG